MAQWYEVEDIQETKLDGFKGSEWYSVKFRGVADNALWLAQKRPDANGKVYGHIERTQSGKGWRFKRDTLPEDGEVPSESSQSASTIPVAPSVAGDIVEQLDRIEKKLDKLLGNDEGLIDGVEALAQKQAERDVAGRNVTNEPLPEFPGDEEGGY